MKNIEKHKNKEKNTHLKPISAIFLLGVMILVILIPSANAGFWDWLFGSNPNADEVLNEMGIQGMKINNFKIDTKTIDKLEEDNSNLKFETELVQTKYGIKQNIWITNKKTNKNFDYSQLTEIDYDTIMWNGTIYKLTNKPITLGSWINKGRLIAPNIFMGKEYKRINYRDIAEKGGYALAYELNGKYYIEFRIDNLNIKSGERYYIDPTYANETDGFSPLSAGVGAGSLLGFTRNATDMWVLDNGDKWIYHFNSTGSNLTTGWKWMDSGCGSPYTIGANDTDFYLTCADDSFVYHYKANGVNQTDGFKWAGISGASTIKTLSIDDNTGTMWGSTHGTDGMMHFDAGGNNLTGGFNHLAAVPSQLGGAAFINSTLFYMGQISYIAKVNEVGSNLSTYIDYDVLTGGSSIKSISLDTATGDLWIADLTDNFVYHLACTGEDCFISEMRSTLNAPVDASTHLKGLDILFNATLTPLPPSINNSNATLFIWNSTDVVNRTTNIVLGNVPNETLFNVDNLNSGSYTWNVLGCGKNLTDYSFCDWDTNRTLTVKLLNVTSYGFNSTAYETESQKFILNFTTISSVTSVSAILRYNGTSNNAVTTCSAGNCSSIATIDIPLIATGTTSENKTFYWDVTLFDGVSLSSSSSNSSINGQNVSLINFLNCGGGSKAINFSIYNETDLSPITAKFLAGFDYYLGSGTVVKNYSYESPADAQSFSFCINPNMTYITTSRIDLSKTGFASRTYEFVKKLYNNISTNQNLYLINSSAPTNIIIEVKNEGLIALRNVVVNISKYYPELNKFIQVESRVTDDFGQFSAKLIQNDAKYMFEFYDYDGNFLKQSPSIIITCKVTVGCTVPFVIEEATTEFDEFTDLTDYIYEFTFNNATNVFRYAWDDQTGESALTRLEVVRLLLNGSSIVCNSTSTSSLSVLSCDVGNQRASYKASIFRTGDNGVERRIAVLNIKVGDISSTFGYEGLLWIFILLFTCIGIGIYNPSVGAGLYGVLFIVFGLIGIISMPAEVFFANTIITVVFIWAVKT